MEAEREFAAAGGDENRTFPWGSLSVGNVYAQYNPTPNLVPHPDNVGTHPLGAARWGHMDMAGNAAEWVFDGITDGYSERVADPACRSADCASLSSPWVWKEELPMRGVRGGSFAAQQFVDLRAAFRTWGTVPFQRGLRCARRAL